jgi:altronate dehydratase large subunit
MASEPHEMIGAEEIMARRAASEEVAADLLRIIHEREVLAKASGLPSRHMSQGNMDGGLTTLEEKSLGAVRKTGTRPIHGVLRNDRNDLDRPTEPGLYIQDGQEMDMPSTTHMVAAGAQVILFTTGRGSTTGHAIAPVIKVTGNPQTYVNMPDNMDVDAGRILTGQTSIAEIGAEIYDLVLRVASGEKTKAELLGFQDFVLYNLDPILANVMRGCPSP